jgi:predicted nucleic acid-binding protein
MVKSFVLDCSATVGIIFGDEPQDYYIGVLERLRDGDVAIVPPLWHYELRNSLLIACRKNKITSQRLADFIQAFQSFAIQTVTVDWVHCLDDVDGDVYLALKQGLTAYDSSYLKLAMTLNLPLATTDKALKKAAHIAEIPDAVLV